MKHALSEALAAKGYDTLTPVQEAVTAPDLVGRDMLVSAQTGSGKTLGFGLAIAPRLFGQAEVFGTASSPLALVIAPTRELALQVKRELAWLYAQAGAVIASTVGGMDMRDERRALARGAHVVVATPGRLRDHIMRGTIDLSALQAVVLDEADEMLDLGFREDLEFILDEAPSDRQTLLFSATVPNAIAKLAQRYQNNAERIATTTGEKQHADIDYMAYRVAPRDVENAIINVLRFYEAPNAIVFCNTRATVNRMTTRLSNRGFSVVALSGELTQSERTNALQAMRDGRARVCVATDVAARGIDLPNLDLVIHAELPTNQETLLHRSGRTGRAGRQGVSALIVPPAVHKKANRLLGWAKLTATWAEAPSAEAVIARDEDRMLSDTDWSADIDGSSADTVAQLADRFTTEQLAAAYVRLWREKHTAPEELSDVHEAPKPRTAFGPSVWFSLPGGRDAGAEPRRLLPMLCKMGNITKDDIGAIRIQDDQSFIEVRKEAVPTLKAALDQDMTLENGAPLTELDSAPQIASGPRPKPGPRPKAGAGRPKKPSTPPVDWNDAPAPKAKKPKGKPKDAPHRAKGPKPSDDTIEPIRPRKPRDDKPRGDKPRGDTPRGDKPARGKPYEGKPKGAKPTTGKNKGGKPPFKGKDGPSKDAGGKPHRKGNSDPSKRARPPEGTDRKGPPPPKGKASSKKNRARAAATKQGGMAAPRKPRGKGA
ncbi:DEAD/DEAH box helicase [Pseudooctadecabacter jejudonensis]|uniref:ATP-dependent RNA helicase DbpA n=1 Tax=Pseudooctadecabacter jejudonensis TaxID=1391910 RepID=A0A1Y5R8U2_9RHOB|nr:DEAD/DEAH box helicase [Pseudooctadecabacter jejudonensis]SLN11769.1 ATP-dependent RNA helicase DbpA [Pseudooctadecabacter jejudonensis]